MSQSYLTQADDRNDLSNAIGSCVIIAVSTSRSYTDCILYTLKQLFQHVVCIQINQCTEIQEIVSRIQVNLVVIDPLVNDVASLDSLLSMKDRINPLPDYILLNEKNTSLPNSSGKY